MLALLLITKSLFTHTEKKSC